MSFMELILLTKPGTIFVVDDGKTTTYLDIDSIPKETKFKAIACLSIHNNRLHVELSDGNKEVPEFAELSLEIGV